MYREIVFATSAPGNSIPFLLYRPLATADKNVCTPNRGFVPGSFVIELLMVIIHSYSYCL